MMMKEYLAGASLLVSILMFAVALSFLFNLKAFMFMVVGVCVFLGITLAILSSLNRKD